MTCRGVLEAVLYAEDLEAGERFYVEVMGLKVVGREAGRHVFFRAGTGMFLLFNPKETVSEGTPVNGVSVPSHGAEGEGHIAFRMNEDEVEGWRARLREAGVPIEAEIEWPQGGRSIYFRDPAGNSAELVTPAVWGLSEAEA